MKKNLPDNNAEHCSAVIEPLEARQLLADSFSLFGSNDGFIGPIYVPPPAVPQAPDSAKVIRRVVSTQSDEVAVIDLTFPDNHPQFERGFWGGTTLWSTSRGSGFNDSRQVAELIARHVRDGGKEPWTQQTIRQNAFTVLDFEYPYFNDKTPEYLAQRVRWFKAAAPDAPVTTYGVNIEAGPYNRLVLQNPTAEQYQAVKTNAERFRPLVNELSAVDVGAYMLGSKTVETDLKAIATMARAVREVYPDKPITAFALGVYVYHTNTRPADADMSDEVLRRYVDMLRTNFDGIFVWGQGYDNERLLKMLDDPDNRKRLPRPATPGTVPLRDDTRPVGTPITSTPIELDEVPAIINEIDL